jgi:deoxyribodipyrimidine photo-lyase
MDTAVFIFRRDLRLEDNTALNAALRAARTVVPCFILDPRQTGSHAYRSDNALRFMMESLADLDAQLGRCGTSLRVYEGIAEEVVAGLVREHNADAVFFNRDYTPFSLKRDTAIAAACTASGAMLTTVDDAVLCAPDTVTTASGGAYTVFTPYARRAAQMKIPRPVPRAKGRFLPAGPAITSLRRARLPQLVPSPMAHTPGGRTAGRALLRAIPQFSAYATTRDIPALPTTRLSAHLKFGTVSMREAYYAINDAFGAGHPLATQLHWHDFFTQVAVHHPRVFGHAFRRVFDKIEWRNDRGAFAAWCEGRTGFPLVDAGMRELRETGFMHNRVRMVVASFLVKDLHIDWREGERHFARLLADYDPAVNNGNWQWAASTGCDAQPYFRIFNPWLQQRRFDPDGTYIRRWVAALRGVPARALHAPPKRGPVAPGYPEPMIDHASESARAKAWYAALRRETLLEMGDD